VPSCCVVAAERLAKRASNPAFLFGDSSFSLISAARLENRASNAAFLFGATGSLFLCSASGRFGSRSITVTSFPSRSKAWITDARGKPNFSILKYLAYSGSSHAIFSCAPSSSEKAARLANRASKALFQLLLAEPFFDSFSAGCSIFSKT